MKITDEMLREAAHGACEQWLASYPDPAPDHTFSPGFEQKINRLIHHPYRRKGLRSLLIAAIIAALMTMTVGADVVPLPTRFSRNSVQIREQILHKSTDWTYTTLFDHTGETRRPVLGWLPAGMTETDRFEFPTVTHIDYKKTNDEYLTVYVHRITVGSANTSSFDTEDAAVSEIDIKGYPALLSVKKNKTLILWFIENYRCSISGTLSTDEIVKVAENMILE